MTPRAITIRQMQSAAIPLFDTVLDRNGRRQLLSLVTSDEVSRDSVIAWEGEVGRDLIVLSDGVVKLWKAQGDGRRQIVAFRTAGDLVSLHRRDTPWTATAQAVTACTFYRINDEGLQALSRSHPQIDRALFDLACDEVGNLHSRLLTLGRMSSTEKLAAFILEFCQPTGWPSPLSREIHLPMRRPDIADYLGLTTESVSREFTRFKNERVIDIPRPSRIIVLNRLLLEAIVVGAGVPDRMRSWPRPEARQPVAG